MKRKRLKRRKRNPAVVRENYRSEGDQPRDEYGWFNGVQTPSNPQGIPPGISDCSADPDRTLAWIARNCKFARKSK